MADRIEFSQAVEAAKEFGSVSMMDDGPETTEFMARHGHTMRDYILSTPPPHEQAAPGGDGWMREFVRKCLDDHLHLMAGGPCDSDDYDAARNRLIEMRAAELAAQCRAGDGWRPIETAPKDSSWILAVMRTKRQAVVRWGGGSWEDDNRLCRDPIMWQPLPATPPNTAN